MQRFCQFQISPCGRIKPQIQAPLQHCKLFYVLKAVLLRLLKVAYKRAGGAHSVFERVAPKRLQRRRTEMHKHFRFRACGFKITRIGAGHRAAKLQRLCHIFPKEVCFIGYRLARGYPCKFVHKVVHLIRNRYLAHGKAAR